MGLEGEQSRLVLAPLEVILARDCQKLSSLRPD
jgi:hypothetical protein